MEFQKHIRWYGRKLRVELVNIKFAVFNLLNRAGLKGTSPTCPVVVSLTSHSTRILKVHHVIQSILLGSLRPERLILWLNIDPETENLPPDLLRLKEVGLEIRQAQNFGPHTKYYPYVLQFSGDGRPLVTADDDCIYPRDWLNGLYRAHVADPAAVHCYKALEIGITGNKMNPYLSWKAVRGSAFKATHFALGVSGVIYPPDLVKKLHDAGDAFTSICPKQDDLWLHVQTLRNGFRVGQVHPEGVIYPTLPGTEDVALFQTNRFENDAAILETYSPGDMKLLKNSPEN